ncbi:uncharacterized protein ACNS7B_021836 [Menidia menidia]
MKPQGTEGQSSVAGSPASSSTSLVPVPWPVSAASVSADCGPSQLRFPPSTPQPPCLWAEALPEEDQEWVVKALFRTGAKGKLELQENLKLWYDPPQPNNVYHQVPSPDRFFAHPLLVWMPHRLWKVKVVCPNPSCGGHQLTGAGLHNGARRVLDVDRIYNMVTETLTCRKCKASHLSWSQVVLQQLDLAHRSEFRVILTQKYACDLRVIRLLRERGQGNSPTRVLKQLMENHTEEWLHRVGRYTTECVSFLQRPGLLPVVFSEPPEPAIVPSCKWLLSVYIQDILTRLEDVKAHITSIYGTILKMNSTKKITKKLAGTAEGTALWLTSVGNEYGQILISVLTAQEGLDEMADGLVSRYAQAGEDPPVALYVDSGCCVEASETTKPQARFSGWPDLLVRLDAWDFMRRLALGCTSNAHQLYPLFMSRLSACIFEWDAADLALLRKAKAQQLQAQGLSSVDVDKHLTRKEFALHCRRRTRGEETTVRLLEELFSSLMGSCGNNFHGVPLFDQERMEHIWRVQKRHVKCIQDPPGVDLYIKTGELTKGGVRLPVLRCARGSASLESFYLHLNRFIPETSASLNFQAYLLEGLHRWNHDRAVAALTTEAFSPCCYSSELLHSVNCKYEKLFGRKLAPEFCPPSRYTGELIGVQYLYRQTGQALQDMNPDAEETAKLVEEQDVAADEDERERFSDLTDDPTIQWYPQVHGTSSSMPVYDTSSSTTVVRDTTSTLGDISSSPACDAVSSTLAPEPKAEAEEESMAVDDQNVPGCQHVDRLAEYLVALGDLKSLRLSSQQASQIIELWNNLNEGEKKQVIHAARHQERVLRSRFRTPKRPSKRPGVESTTRCVLGETSAPAQWPDCCGLVETMFIRLCALYPGPRRKGKRAESRWTLILRHYRKIGELVVGNARVMQGTDIRLAEVNQNTLIQWHKKRQKTQKLSALLQEAALPPVDPVSEEPLPEPRALPAEPPAAQQEHKYRLPGNTAGQARQRETPRPIVPKGTVKRPVFVAKPTAPAVPAAPIVPARLILGTAQPVLLYRYVFPEKAGATPKRPYRRTVEANTCKKCGQFRTAETGHSQFRGKVYCPNFEAVTKQQWLEEMRKRLQK